jgi:hypothetical protein
MATHCKAGHQLSGDNLRVRSNGERRCVACMRFHNNKRRANLRAAGVVIDAMTESRRQHLETVAGNYVEQNLHCRNGHPWLGNVRVVRNRINCIACERARSAIKNKTAIPSKIKVAAVIEGLHHGLSINQMTTSSTRKRRAHLSRESSNNIVSSHLIWNFIRQNPKLGNRMKALSIKNGKQNYRNAMRSRITVAAAPLRSNNGFDAFAAVQRATAGIWEDDRGDVQAMMFIAIGEGKLRLSDITPTMAKEFLGIHRRRPRVYGCYSLDATIGEDGSTTWIDTVGEDRALWR